MIMWLGIQHDWPLALLLEWWPIQVLLLEDVHVGGGYRREYSTVIQGAWVQFKLMLCL